MKERMSVTIPVDLLAKVREMAKKDERTISAMVTVLVRSGMEQKEKAE